MIKFFRHIRQNLIMENKTSKYFKYAIGEIVLVVIGILIALQINNWNETTKEEVKENIYLNNLERDLTDQLISIDNQILYETISIEASSYLIEQYNSNKLTDLDTSFFNRLSELHSRKTFVITDPTFTDLLSSGSINLIKNEQFKDELIQYYQELERVEKVIQNNNSYLTDQQFGINFLKLGYYYNDLKTENNRTIPKVKSVELTSVFQKELAKTSENLLLIPGNKLLLMNIINMRHSVSLSHLGSMEETKNYTQNLLTDLRSIKND
jgi:hypothetical protein